MEPADGSTCTPPPSPQAAPWSKTGGLGDVSSSLPKALAARGSRVMTILPRYDPYPEAKDTGLKIGTWLFGGWVEVKLFHCRKDGVDWVFVDHPSFLRGSANPYGDENGPYGDNQFRYSLLSKVACEIPLQLDFGKGLGTYGDDIIFVCNDWQAGLVPMYVAAHFRPHGVYKQARTIMCIHNMCHQGVCPPSTYQELGLPDNWYGAMGYQYPPHLRQGAYEEEGHSVNHLKGGIVTADRVMTVSPSYAMEIQSPEGGWGLESCTASRYFTVNGVVNGIDTEVRPGGELLGGLGVVKVSVSTERCRGRRGAACVLRCGTLKRTRRCGVATRPRPWCMASARTRKSCRSCWASRSVRTCLSWRSSDASTRRRAPISSCRRRRG